MIVGVQTRIAAVSVDATLGNARISRAQPLGKYFAVTVSATAGMQNEID